MRAFIIRPFGVKKDLKGNEIDFDKVAKELIDPALTAIDAEGRETLDIVESGNIRVDMFRRLLTADLVVADLSIHNANVFYELGIRHALRDHGTLMLRSDGDAFPFDLQTDRYFVYDKNNPAASVAGLTASLRAIEAKAQTDFDAKDSPVFTSLPKLKEPEPWLFNPVPQDFGEDVVKAFARNQAGDLVLYSDEIKGFEWESPGWRVVGKAQFDINATAGAKATWEHVLKLDPADLEANILLGTIYQRLGDLESSTLALKRALDNKAIGQDQRAEAYALIGRNSKTRWRKEWESKPANERAAVALRSRYLKESFENYKAAFDEHLNHFYSGLNALAMLKIMIGLAQLQPDVWNNLSEFADDDEAARGLKTYTDLASRLQAAVRVSLDAAFKRLKRDGQKDVWAEISNADHLFLTTTTGPKRVATAYENALAGAPAFAAASVATQLAVYRDLGVLIDNLEEVFKVVAESPPLPAPGAPPAPKPDRKRVLVFAGHMIDAPDRKTPRFPADQEAVAREEIKQRVLKEMNSGSGVASAYAGGASGGDILFMEVCAELGIETRMYLAVLPQIYVNTSVNKAGGNWVDRFWKLLKAHTDRNQVRILSEVTEARDDKDYLPAWLQSKKDYGIWQRNNLWMLYNALAESCDNTTGDPNLTLIALWDGDKGDGPGGTGDLVEKVQRLGGRNETINTKQLFKL